MVLGCFDGLGVWCWISSTKGFDGRGYGEVAVTVGVLKEFEVVLCRHFGLETRLACVCGKYAKCLVLQEGWGRGSLLLADGRVMRSNATGNAGG